jgi:hypothetical protein
LTLDVLSGCTFRHSLTAAWLPVGEGVGDGLDDLVGLGDGLADLVGLGDGLAVLVGLGEALLVAAGVAEELLLAFGVADALELALGVADTEEFALGVELAVGVAGALALADALLAALAVDLGAAFGAAWITTAAARVTVAWPFRAAAVCAGGWPQAFEAAASCTASLVVAASAAVPPASRLPTIPEETSAAPATAPSADGPQRGAVMGAPWSPRSSSLRPHMSSSDRAHGCARGWPFPHAAVQHLRHSGRKVKIRCDLGEFPGLRPAARPGRMGG